MRKFFLSMPWVVRYPLAVAFVPIWLLVSVILMIIDVLLIIVPLTLIEMVSTFAGHPREMLGGKFLAERWFDLL